MNRSPREPHQATAGRRLGARLLGPAFPFLLHTRPAEWPVIAGHTALGWLLARGMAGVDGPVVLGLALWVIALNGGTLAINSAFDQDEGDIAYLKSPPPAPRGLAPFALVLLCGGALLTWWMPPTFRWLYGLSFLMSVAYSVPPFRFKAVAGMDWLINMVGFGSLTPWAGWAITGAPLDLEHGLVIWGFCPLFAALYPLTQIYQIDADRERGDRTLVIELGVERSLLLALVFTGIAFLCFGVAAWVGGWWGGAGGSPLRMGLLLLAALAWLVVLLPWYRGAERWSPSQHQRGMYHALAAWALTDLALALAWLA